MFIGTSAGPVMPDGLKDNLPHTRTLAMKEYG